MTTATATATTPTRLCITCKHFSITSKSCDWCWITWDAFKPNWEQKID